jgi:structural maintenance of chromosome 2
VIMFGFSDTLICHDAASAQVMTFAREVGVRSITLDGDVYEPGGTMSGGAAPSGEAAGRAVRDAWRAREREVEIEEHELRLLKEQVGTSNAARVRIAFYGSTFLFHFVLKWMVLSAKDRRTLHRRDGGWAEEARGSQDKDQEAREGHG